MSSRSLILSGIRIVLRPVVQLCIRNGVSAAECLELLKGAFVDVAKEDLVQGGHKVNASRLSVATGLRRKDIANLSELSASANDSILMKVIGQWQMSKSFLTKAGKARPLTHEGSDSEFAQLVRTVSTDINPYTILFELERTKRVTRGDGVVQLSTVVLSLESPEDFERASKVVERDWTDMFAAVEENLRGVIETPHLHLRTEFDNVTLDAIPRIREWILDRGTTFHEEVREYVAKFDKDANPRLHKKEGGGRVVVSAYGFTETGQAVVSEGK